MAERDRARGMTQRQLEIAERTPDAPSPAPDPPSGPAASPVPAEPEEPSNARLRERQARWLAERARFRPPEPAVKPSSESK